MTELEMEFESSNDKKFYESNIDASLSRSSTSNDLNQDALPFNLKQSPSIIGKFVKDHRNIFKNLGTYKTYAKPVFGALCLVGYIIYFGFAMSDQYGGYPFPFPNGNYILFILTIIAFLFAIWDNLIPLLNRRFKLEPKIKAAWNKYPIIPKYLPICIGSAVVIAALITLLVFVIKAQQISSLQSIAGLFIIFVVVFLTSEYPEYIKWRAVIGGLCCQFWLGFFVLQTSIGFTLVKWLSNQVETFLNFSLAGAEFIYGSLSESGAFAINVLSIVMYVSAIVSALYYLGWMQWLVGKLGSVLVFLLDTSPTESINSAANIFLGQSEAPLLIKPFVNHMTPSELFALLVGGFASVAGSVLGAFINFGVPPVHLVTACVMSAPGALAMSKFSFPETQQTRVNFKLIKEYKGDGSSKNVVDAILAGAMLGLQICGGILSSIIAILSILALIDALTQWFFSMVHYPEINFQSLLSYIFSPVAFFIGLHPRDCLIAGRLIGVKTFLNEFVAFDTLGAIQRLRNAMIEDGSFADYDCGRLAWNSTDAMLWEQKSIDIMTYALCGFANFCSIGIQISSLSILAPSKRPFFTKYIMKAMIMGIVTNVVTATIAALLYDPSTNSYIRNCTV